MELVSVPFYRMMILQCGLKMYHQKSLDFKKTSREFKALPLSLEKCSVLKFCLPFKDQFLSWITEKKKLIQGLINNENEWLTSSCQLMCTVPNK